MSAGRSIGFEVPNNPDRAKRPALVNLSVWAVATKLTNGQYRDQYVPALESVINGVSLNSPGWTGIPVIVSANNFNTSETWTAPALMSFQNAPNFASPGHVISVGATELREDANGAIHDYRWICDPARDGAAECTPVSDGVHQGVTPGSDYGNNVDFWAPGHNVDAAHSDGGYRQSFRSGTSFAAPLVAGLLARIMQVEGPLSPTAAYQRLNWSSVNVFDPANPGALDPFNYNSRIVNRLGAEVCSPEYP